MSDDRADQMREALEFYAAPETWCVSGDTHEGEVKAYRDGGAIARAALDASPPPSPVEDARRAVGTEKHVSLWDAINLFAAARTLEQRIAAVPFVESAIDAYLAAERGEGGGA